MSAAFSEPLELPVTTTLMLRAIADIARHRYPQQHHADRGQRDRSEVGRRLGLSRQEMLPSDKAEVIREFRRNGNIVAMVGDGIIK